MDIEKIENMKVEDLIGLRSHLKVYLSKLNYQNPEHRQIAVDAIELYIKKYISSAMYLSDTTIDGVVGEEITGLGLSVLFDSNQKDLSRPSDEEIDDVLTGLAKRTPTPQLRDDFWAAWLLRNADSCIKGLCNFLEEPLNKSKERQVEETVLEREIKQLKEIYKIPMTGIRTWIELLIEKEQEVLDKWYKETTKSSQ